jgi:catechol 2,3-dioxygenase-like lactoylglutathione lyase family enzyme
MPTSRNAFLLSAVLLAAQEPTVAHFHHIHLNSTDPPAAAAFYSAHFDCEKTRFAKTFDAVWAQKSWLLFSKVDTPPPSEILSAIWHFGWGAEDMPAAYRKQLDLGAKFETPITDISDLARYKGFYYAYVDGPDHALIELNTAPHHRFGHLHLLSADPIAAGDWYAKHLGVKVLSQSKKASVYKGFAVAPSSSLMVDNVNILIFPMEYAYTAFPKLWEGRKAFESTKGRVVDHIGFSVDNLPETLQRLKNGGVTISEDSKTAFGGKLQYAFIEGPDRIRIELVEDHTQRENASSEN